jgi:hypothetical protein
MEAAAAAAAAAAVTAAAAPPGAWLFWCRTRQMKIKKEMKRD